MGLSCSSRILPADGANDSHLHDSLSAAALHTHLLIEQELTHSLAEDRRIIKCLLLGAGECGKSTIMKQMKILHGTGFTEREEQQTYKQLIVKNTLDSIQSLCQACITLEIPWESTEQQQQAQEIIQFVTDYHQQTYKDHHRHTYSHTYTNNSTTDTRNTSSSTSSSSDNSHTNTTPVIPAHIPPLIYSLWNSAPLLHAVTRCNEFQLLDSAPYFLSHCLRIFAPDYQPIDADILRSRLSTTGIIESTFKIDKLTFKMLDVGGQRGERKKWIHCFDHVTAILFIASLSEYDQVLSEDRTRNRMKESLDLFEGINGLPWFRHIPIILFLNKADLFAAKVKQVDLGTYFPQYTGGHHMENGLKFIQDEYLNRNLNPYKNIYCHVTNATNTENIAFVWKAAKHIILEQSLHRSGMLM